jgi:hypothetical protein
MINDALIFNAVAYAYDLCDENSRQADSQKR